MKKKKQPIDKKQLYDFLKKKHIDDAKLISMTKSEEGRAELNNIFRDYGDAYFTDKGLVQIFELDDGETDELFVGRPDEFNYANIDSIDSFIDMMNSIIDTHNMVIDHHFAPEFDTLYDQELQDHGNNKRFDIGVRVVNENNEEERLEFQDTDLFIKDVAPLSPQEVRLYIKEHSDIDPNDLYGNASFIRQTKAGAEILNKTLSHFTGYEMNVGTGVTYIDPQGNGTEFTFGGIKSFNDVKDFDDLVSIFNMLRVQTQRNKEILKKVIENQEKQKDDERER